MVYKNLTKNENSGGGSLVIFKPGGEELVRTTSRGRLQGII